MADLDRILTDVGYFAEVIDRPLTPWQAESLKLDQLMTVLVAGRQMGKSRSLAVLALWWALTRPRSVVLIVSAGELGARRLLAEVREAATGSPLLAASVVDEQAGLLTLTNGSQVRSVPASPKAVRGWRVDLLLIDEAGSPSADVLLSAALPTVTARPDARVVMADSAWAAEGPFYDHATLGLQGSAHARTFRWIARAAGGEMDAPWVSPTAVALARETLGPLRFGAEYLCEFSGAADAMFSRDLLRRSSAPVALPDAAGLGPRARLLGGCDWAGAGLDRTALVAWGRLPVGEVNGGLDLPVFGIATAQAWPAGYPAPDACEEIAACPAHWAVMSSERNGVGEHPTQVLFRALRARSRRDGGGDRRRVWAQHDIERSGRAVVKLAVVDGRVVTGDDAARAVAVSTTERGSFATRKLAVWTDAEMKAQTFGRLRYAADRGQLVFPAETELLRELAALRVELRPSGTVGIAAVSGAHDDLAMAMAVAAGPYKGKDGQWRSFLTDLSERPLPETPVPQAERRRTVETGDGLTVFRAPVLQSVAGMELTLPELCETAEPDPGSDEALAREWHIERRGRGRVLRRKSPTEIGADLAPATDGEGIFDAA